MYGLKTHVMKAYFLADKEKRALPIRQTYETARDEYRMHVELPKEPMDILDTVVVLELDGQPEVYHW